MEWPILARKFLKVIEHISYAIKYCKISSLIYSGSSSLSNAGRFFDSPARDWGGGLKRTFTVFLNQFVSGR